MPLVHLNIAQQSFFNNGDIIINLLKDKTNIPLKTAVSNWICQDYSLISKQHSTKNAGSWNGYSATDINQKLRAKIISINGIHGETHVENRGLFHNSKQGFDFSLYDEDCNYVRLRNSHIGNPGIYDGNTVLDNLYKKLRDRNNDSIKMNKTDWNTILTNIGGVPGINLPENKTSLTVVGEIQFGNWALAEHDMFRLINSSSDNSIDYYVYVTPTANFAKKFSDNIVNYDKVLDILNENIQKLNTPMWIIGIDEL